MINDDWGNSTLAAPISGNQEPGLLHSNMTSWDHRLNVFHSIVFMHTLLLEE